jgi:hypothetical protein
MTAMEVNSRLLATSSGDQLVLRRAEVFRDTEHIKIAVKFNEASVSGNDNLARFLDYLKAKTD